MVIYCYSPLQSPSNDLSKQMNAQINPSGPFAPPERDMVKAYTCSGGDVALSVLNVPSNFSRRKCYLLQFNLSAAPTHGSHCGC